MKNGAQANISPADAIALLKAGNVRFLENNTLEHNYLEQMKQTATGQYPFAVVLGCIDSRVPAELIFNQGIGDIFNIRIAGNIINADIIASMEYACKVAGAKAIVVLGHTCCGAIKAACEGVKLANITDLLQKIKPAITEVSNTLSSHNFNNNQFIEKTSEINVLNSLQNIEEQSNLLSKMKEKGEILIVGAMYNVATGQVQFFSTA